MERYFPGARGSTLLELMLVTAIIGVITAILVPSGLKMKKTAEATAESFQMPGAVYQDYNFSGVEGLVFPVAAEDRADREFLVIYRFDGNGRLADVRLDKLEESKTDDIRH